MSLKKPDPATWTDFLLLAIMVVGVLSLMGYGLTQAFEHGAHQDAGAGTEDTIIGMLIGSGFLVLQKLLEIINIKWHNMRDMKVQDRHHQQVEHMTQQLHRSQPVDGDFLEGETGALDTVPEYDKFEGEGK